MEFVKYFFKYNFPDSVKYYHPAHLSCLIFRTENLYRTFRECEIPVHQLLITRCTNIIDRTAVCYTSFPLKFRHIFTIAQRKHISLQSVIFAFLYCYSMKKTAKQFAVLFLSLRKAVLCLL